jgi:hypothetical protein
MQTLDDKHYVELELMAKKRGITVQQFLRAVIVPEWMDGRAGKLVEGGRRARNRRSRRRLVPMLTA